MPARKTRVKSERMAELGRRAAASVPRDPVTHRFVKRPDPGVESDAGSATSSPPGGDPAPFATSLRLWGRLRRRPDR
jgi:hypothetical protein